VLQQIREITEEEMKNQNFNAEEKMHTCSKDEGDRSKDKRTN